MIIEILYNLKIFGMVYLAVDKDGTERIMSVEDWKPYVGSFGNWFNKFGKAEGGNIVIPKGTIAKIIGREITFDDGLVMI